MANPSPVRVLVVDDEKGLRDVLSYALCRLKYEVAAAADGERALAAARAGDFDVVLCDVMMPGMSGLEVLEALRRERPEVEVVMVTGSPTPESAARAEELGAFGYVIKPYELAALVAVVDQAAARKRGRVAR